MAVHDKGVHHKLIISHTSNLVTQDTIKRPSKGSEAHQMKKATTLAIFITTGFYLAVGCVGYAGFGNDAPGNLLTGFGFYNPYWLIDLANVFIMVHLVGAYQVRQTT